MDDIKRVVVAGNGPSLANIDYDRMPTNCDIFRCNHFYFEDSYYLGKNIKMAFMHLWPALEKYYTFKTLQERGEYNIDQITLATFGVNTAESHFQLSQMRDYFVDAVFGHEILARNKKLYATIIFNEIYNKGMRVTSGVYMCAVATVLGYKEIYITGIDFYEGNDYAFDISDKANLIRIDPAIKERINTGHDKGIDMKMLYFLQNFCDVKVYCISPSSPACQIVDTAPFLVKSSFVPMKKEEDATRDVLIPDAYAYRNFMKKEEAPKPNDYKLLCIKNNIYARFIIDLFILPRDIIRYMRYRIQKSFSKYMSFNSDGGQPLKTLSSTTRHKGDSTNSTNTQGRLS